MRMCLTKRAIQIIIWSHILFFITILKEGPIIPETSSTQNTKSTLCTSTDYQKVKTDFSQTRHEKESLKLILKRARLVRPTSAVASTCFSVKETSAVVV